ncbi:MAG: DUF2062 domain-containing protein [Candidatus Omnitrophota bacterium]|jgi:hypothetical protein
MIKRFLKIIYEKLFKINDTPQRIALGLGVGVFMGLIPGTGPIASVFVAAALRVNRAAALLGSLLTNTWVSVLTFFLSIKIGSAIMKVDWQQAQEAWFEFLKGFRFAALFKTTTLNVLLPVIAGYAVVGFFLAAITYLAALAAIKLFKK